MDVLGEKEEVDLNKYKDSPNLPLMKVSEFRLIAAKAPIVHYFVYFYQKLMGKLEACKKLKTDSSCDYYAHLFICIRDAWKDEKQWWMFNNMWFDRKTFLKEYSSK